MNNKLMRTLVAGFSITLGSLMLNISGSNAGVSNYTFKCDTINGIPTTVAERQGKQTRMISWSKNDGYFGENWTPLKRCQKVSAEFQKYAQQGNLRYITHGEKNGYPIVCVTTTKTGSCTGQLFTLRKGSNANETVRHLLDKERLSNNDPLPESSPAYVLNVNDQVYLDLDIYLDSEEVANTNNNSNQEHSTTPNTNNNSQSQEEGSAWFGQ